MNKFRFVNVKKITSCLRILKVNHDLVLGEYGLDWTTEKWFVCRKMILDRKMIFMSKIDFWLENWFLARKLISGSKNDFCVKKCFLHRKIISASTNDFWIEHDFLDWKMISGSNMIFNLKILSRKIIFGSKNKFLFTVQKSFIGLKKKYFLERKFFIENS